MSEQVIYVCMFFSLSHCLKTELNEWICIFMNSAKFPILCWHLSSYSSHSRQNSHKVTYICMYIYIIYISMFKCEDPISLRCALIRISQLHFNLINQCIDTAWARLLIFIQMPQHFAYIQMPHSCTYVHTCMCLHTCGKKEKLIAAPSSSKLEQTENLSRTDRKHILLTIYLKY